MTEQVYNRMMNLQFSIDFISSKPNSSFCFTGIRWLLLILLSQTDQILSSSDFLVLTFVAEPKSHKYQQASPNASDNSPSVYNSSSCYSFYLLPAMAQKRSL